MRRLYVCPYITIHDNSDLFGGIGAHYVDLIAPMSEYNVNLKRHWDHNHTDNAEWRALPEVAAWIATGGLVVAQATVDHNEYCEDKWHSHPDVAVLPHPTFEGNDPISKHIIVRAAVTKGSKQPGAVLSGSPTKKIEQKHLDALAVLGVVPTDTVWYISDKAAARIASVKLRAVL